MLLRFLLFFVHFSHIVTAFDDFGTSGKLRFSNLGYDDTIRYISKINNATSDNCECTLGPPEWFAGPNAPLSERLVAHIRGPIKLQKFAFYNVRHFVFGSDNNTFNWTQQALFDVAPDSISKQTINVTFLGHKGKYSPCTGRALTFIGQDAVSYSQENPDPLGFSGSVESDEEFIIFSNFPCPRSKWTGMCGYYKKGIRSYTGYEGQTKMFLFEFTMPTDNSNKTEEGILHYDEPAIWLANERLSRATEYYNWNNNCSCLFHGCGAYQVFATNETNRDLMYSSVQTFQGVDRNTSRDHVLLGTVSDGQFIRPRNTTVRGGVIFDSEGNIVTFLTNNTQFHEYLSPEQVEDMLYDIPNIGKEKVLPSGTSIAPNTTSSSNGSVLVRTGGEIWKLYFTLLTTIIQFFLL